MKLILSLVLCGLVVLSVSTPCQGVVLDGIQGRGWPHGTCYLASLGQLMLYADPNLSQMDVIVRSGMCTQASWERVGNMGYQLGMHPRAYDNGAQVDMARLCGVRYHVGYGRDGSGGAGWVAAADSVTEFTSESQAVDALKAQIDAGVPVQVHVDIAYIAGDVGAENPFWSGPQGAASHFMVVHGYDEQYVYMADNAVVDPNVDITGVGIPVTWAHFLDGWYEAMALTPDRHLMAGPWFMSYLVSEPSLADDDWTLAYLAGDAQDAPDCLRSCAAALRQGTSAESPLVEFNVSVFRSTREGFVTYLEGKGLAAIADVYDASAALWYEIWLDDSNALVPTWLDDIADLESQGLELLAALDEGEDFLAAVSPADGAELSDLADVTFAWNYMPVGATRKVVVELAMTGDFADRRSVVKLKAAKGATSRVMDGS